MITSNIIKFLPRGLRKKVENNRELRKILGNINWLTFENIFKNLIGVLIFAWVARYLGPEQFGLMNYAIAFVALFSVLGTLGLDNIVIREIVSNPEKKGEYLGSTLLLKFLGSLLLLIFSVIVISFIEPGNNLIQIFVLILAFGHIFKSFDVVDLWFKSQVQSQYSVYARSISFVFVSALKIFAVLTQAPLIAFVVIIAFDFFLISIFFIYFYIKKGEISFKEWKVKLVTIKSLLRDSWPLMLSGVAVMIYMKIDQIMIGNMIGEKELGVYSVAVKLSEAWYFLPMIIAGSVFPAILRAKKKSEKLYLDRMQMLYDGFTWFTIPVALVITFLSPFIINLLYGAEYAGAAVVLSIHIWAGVFVFLGVASSKYLIAENLTKISFYTTTLGAIINIALNFFLISKYGILGAAISTLVSYASSACILNLLFMESRKVFIMQIRSINIFRILKL